MLNIFDPFFKFVNTAVNSKTLPTTILKTHFCCYNLFLIIGKYLCLVIICLAGVAVPSIISAFYYITFLGIMTWWSCYHPISRGFAYLFRFVCLVACIHVSVLFVYQMEWAQILLPPDSPIAR